MAGPEWLLSVHSSRSINEHNNNTVYLVGAVVLLHPWLQANVQVKLLFLVVACPCHLFKAVGLSVDELGILRHRLVGIPGIKSNGGKGNWNISSYGLTPFRSLYCIWCMSSYVINGINNLSKCLLHKMWNMCSFLCWIVALQAVTFHSNNPKWLPPV